MTGDKPTLSQLHDATLRGVHIDWSSGEVRFELTAALAGIVSSPLVLHANAVSLLRCPRQAPWGWSVSINDVRCAPIQDGRVRLEVEVQSGDVIEVEAGAVSVEVVA